MVHYRRGQETILKCDGHFQRLFPNVSQVIFERTWFIQGNQLPEEATKLKTLTDSIAENCEFGDFKDELFRDRLVVGILKQKTADGPLSNC